MCVFHAHISTACKTVKKKNKQKNRGDRVGDWTGQENSFDVDSKNQGFYKHKNIKNNKGEK